MYFLPYGTMVDEFQHIMYAEPDLTPGERNAVWAKLESEYRPWLDFAGLPFYGRGAGWQRQAAHLRGAVLLYRPLPGPNGGAAVLHRVSARQKRTPGGGTWRWWARPAARRIRVSWRRPGWTARLLPERWRSWAKKWARGSRRRTPR